MNHLNAAPGYRFHHAIKVRFSETDLQGHVFFGHYLTYFDVALMEYLAALDMNYQQMLDAGMDMVYAEALCQYKAPAFVEETLHISVRAADVGNSSLRLEFAVHESRSNRLVVSGHVVAVAVDPKTHQKIRIPDPVRQAIERFEGR